MNELDKAMENLKAAMNGEFTPSARGYKGHYLNRAGMTSTELKAHKEKLACLRVVAIARNYR